MSSVVSVYRQLTWPGGMSPSVMTRLMVTGTMALAVDVALAELGTEEAEDEADVIVGSAARFSNSPGSHVEGAQSVDAWTGMDRQTAIAQSTRRRGQTVALKDLMAVGE